MLAWRYEVDPLAQPGTVTLYLVANRGVVKPTQTEISPMLSSRVQKLSVCGSDPVPAECFLNLGNLQKVFGTSCTSRLFSGTMSGRARTLSVLESTSRAQCSESRSSLQVANGRILPMAWRFGGPSWLHWSPGRYFGLTAAFASR